MAVSIGSLLSVVETEAGFGIPGVKAGVVIQQIVEKLVAIRIAGLLRVWITRHGVKRQGVHRERIAFVEIHVFHKTIGEKQIIARPSGRKWRQNVGIEIKRDLIARAEDDESVV